MNFSIAKVPKVILLSFCCLIADWIVQNQAYAQTPLPCNTITEEMGFTVRSVRIEGRWVPQELRERVQQIVGVGQPFSPTVINPAIEEVRNVLTAGENDLAQNDSSRGATSVLYIIGETCDVSDDANPKQAEITIRPYYLRVDLLNINNNVLPIPRVNTPTFSAGVPPALLATAPIVGFSVDRNYGQSFNLQTKTDLLNLPLTNPINSKNEATDLNLTLNARRSLSESFYNISTGLEYTRPEYSGGIGRNISVRYSNQFEPLGEGEDWREQVHLEGGIQGKLEQSLIRSYALGGGVRFSDNSYTPRQSDAVQNSETGLQLYAIGDSRIGNGFARFGAWFDAGFPSEASSYQRLAVQGGYATEIGSGHNTIGLQVIAGSGYAWGGNPPEYSRFFGGAMASNYLYEPLNSAQVRTFPTGPLLRSFGEQQAGLRARNGLINGGNFYWHLNFNMTFPIPQLSQPLIPDIALDDRRTLRSALKGQIRAVQNSIFVDLVDNQGYPENEETEALAQRIVNREIAPTINYLTDRANLYSVKPMLLFDVAQISGNDGLGSRTWAAVGGGIQVNVVNGRLEMGYMQTVAPASDSSIGNFFLRLVFQDFF
ncbi:MAG: hypothetical protein IM556_02980 [Pseudanabaena sp. M110S1SP2A07QC]|nr:hypothetical protein [Microcystis sp. M043S2]MCA6517608.1 hypothetical protein [Pseudanabaena sp. M110S1SP2A07QC]